MKERGERKLQIEMKKKSRVFFFFSVVLKYKIKKKRESPRFLSLSGSAAKHLWRRLFRNLSLLERRRRRRRRRSAAPDPSRGGPEGAERRDGLPKGRGGGSSRGRGRGGGGSSRSSSSAERESLLLLKRRRRRKRNSGGNAKGSKPRSCSSQSSKRPGIVRRLRHHRPQRRSSIARREIPLPQRSESRALGPRPLPENLVVGEPQPARLLERDVPLEVAPLASLVAVAREGPARALGRGVVPDDGAPVARRGRRGRRSVVASSSGERGKAGAAGVVVVVVGSGAEASSTEASSEASTSSKSSSPTECRLLLGLRAVARAPRRLFFCFVLKEVEVIESDVEGEATTMVNAFSLFLSLSLSPICLPPSPRCRWRSSPACSQSHRQTPWKKKNRQKGGFWSPRKRGARKSTEKR